MMGVPIYGPAKVRYSDNKSVLYSTSRPESMLKKKNEFISYHYVRERIAMGVLRVYWIKSSENLADCLIKKQARVTLLDMCMKMTY